jgi:sugar phosphate isomerase/epimerase
LLNLRGIKARPHDLDAMIALRPSLVELHCSSDDLKWKTTRASYGVPLAVHVPEYSNGELLDPASLDEAARLRAQDLYVDAVYSAIGWAAAFNGRPRVVFHPGGQTVEEHARGGHEELSDALGKTVDAMKAAAGDDVEVLIENLPKVCWFNAGSWRARHMTSGVDIAEFCRWKKIGATLDLCHLHLTPHDVISEIACMKPHIRHVHYSDGRFKKDGREVYEEGLQIGEGDMPLPSYLSELAGLPGDIFGVPEIWFGHENGGSAFVEAWKRTQASVMAAAGR